MYRKNAIVAGVLFFIGTVTGVLSVVVMGPIVDADNYLAEIADNETRFIVGNLLILAMGLSLAMVPVALYPALRRVDEVLAQGYLLFRGALETVTYFFTVLGYALLLVISREMGDIAPADANQLQHIATVLRGLEPWTANLLTFVFITGAFMLYYILFRYRLLPRWLSVWGLLSAVPYALVGFLVLFDVVEHNSDADTLLRMPLAFQEMVMAGWFVARGLQPAAFKEIEP